MMMEQSSKINSLNTFLQRFQTLCTAKWTYSNNKLYEDLLTVENEEQVSKTSEPLQKVGLQNDEDVSKSQVEQSLSSEIPHSLQQQSNQPQSLPLNNFIKPHINNPQLSQQDQSLQPIVYSKQSLKLKQNPRMHKFIKQENNLLKEKQKQKQRERKQIEQRQAMQQLMAQKAKELKELKEKQIKKFQLKQKLRKLNQQLDKEKKQLRSQQKQGSFFQQNDQLSSFANPEASQIQQQKASVSFIHQNSFIQKSGLRSRSDAEFRVKKLKQQEAVYIPVKHEAAFRLIEKMHLEKLKKHEKLMSKMKKKQEKEIEMVRKLEEEKMKEKNLRRVRQVLYYTPQLTRVKKEFQKVRENVFKREKDIDINPQNKKTQLKPILKPNYEKGLKQVKETKPNEAEEEISLVIPRQPQPQDSQKKKKQTIFTQEYEQETFQPVTEEGKQFAEALNRQSLGETEKLEQEKEYLGYQYDNFIHDEPNEEIIVENEFI